MKNIEKMIEFKQIKKIKSNDFVSSLENYKEIPRVIERNI